VSDSIYWDFVHSGMTSRRDRWCRHCKPPHGEPQCLCPRFRGWKCVCWYRRDLLVPDSELAFVPRNTGIEPHIPALCTRVTPDTKYDWNYTTVPQPGFDNREIPIARGFLLGGSSSVSRCFSSSSSEMRLRYPVDYMLYARGPADDWDRLAAFTGDDGWTWENLEPYWKRVSVSV